MEVSSESEEYVLFCFKDQNIKDKIIFFSNLTKKKNFILMEESMSTFKK